MRVGWMARLGLMFLVAGGLVWHVTTAYGDQHPPPDGFCENVRLRVSAKLLDADGNGSVIFQIMCPGAVDAIRDYKYDWQVQGTRPAFCELANEEPWSVSLDANCPLIDLAVQVTITAPNNAKLKLRANGFCDALRGCYTFP